MATMRDAIGEAIYGIAYHEAHAEPEKWAHLVEEQDRMTRRVEEAIIRFALRPERSN